MKEAEKEEVFHLKQSIGRARKRLDEDRAQPIDVLVQLVHLQGSHPLADPRFKPHHVFDNFRADGLRALLEEVQQFQVTPAGWSSFANVHKP
jgi:Conserved mid region of cactin